MTLSFSGSSTRGWTTRQRDRVHEILEEFRPIVVHGACVMQDDQFDSLAHSMGLTRFVFPSNHPTKSALSTCLARGGRIYESREPMHPLKRNPLIVQASNRFIATPKEQHEVLRSGTWATIRYARKTLGISNMEIILP
jgi:hypothetical protein